MIRQILLKRRIDILFVGGSTRHYKDEAAAIIEAVMVNSDRNVLLVCQGFIGAVVKVETASVRPLTSIGSALTVPCVDVHPRLGPWTI